MEQEKNAENTATENTATENTATENTVTKNTGNKSADSKKPKEPAKATVRKSRTVKFLLSPTGRFGLAYNAGEKADINELQATELVDAGYAEFIK